MLVSIHGEQKKVNASKASEMSFSLHTIVLLIGLDGSGKSSFAKNHLIPGIRSFSQHDKKKIAIVNVNQDEILRKISDSPSKEKSDLLEYYPMAKKVAITTIESAARYPVSSEFIIVDCDAMDEDFRHLVLTIAEENGYKIHAIVFDLPPTDYYYYNGFGTKVEIKSPAKKRIRQLMSGQIQSEKYSQVDTITSRKYPSIVVNNHADYEQFILPEGPEYVLIGDIHGCLDEFKELLVLNGFVIGEDLKVHHPENKKVLLIGDLIDKGYDIAGVIEFVYANMDQFYMVIGNHEAFVYRLLKKISSTKDSTSEVRKTFFDSYDLLKEYEKVNEDKVYESYLRHLEDKTIVSTREEVLEEYYRENPIPSAEEVKKTTELREKFFAIVERMKSFFVHKDFVVTHAPCESKYLGKINDSALKAARDFRYPKQADYEDFSTFMYEFDLRTAYIRIEASDSYKLHVFGHVMSKEVSRFKNKICIDTGCVAGGKLSSLTISGRRKLDIKSVPASAKVNSKNKELFNFFA